MPIQNVIQAGESYGQALPRILFVLRSLLQAFQFERALVYSEVILVRHLRWHK